MNRALCEFKFDQGSRRFLSAGGCLRLCRIACDINTTNQNDQAFMAGCSPPRSTAERQNPRTSGAGSRGASLNKNYHNLKK
jgi:hypothetical protein